MDDKNKNIPRYFLKEFEDNVNVVTESLQTTRLINYHFSEMNDLGYTLMFTNDRHYFWEKR